MATWQTYTLGSLFTSDPIGDVLCVAPHKWVICGWGGNVAYSTDDGQTWTASTGQAAINWNALASDGTTVVMVGDVADPADRIAVSSDFGATWTMIASAAALGASWYGVCAVTTGTFVAFSGPTAIIKSTNSGATWSNADVSALSGFSNAFRGGVANADGSLVVGLTDAVPPEIAVSTDQGSTWAVGTSPTDCVSGVGFGTGSNQIQVSADDLFVIPGRTDSTNDPAIWTSADATAWVSTVIDATLTGAPSPFMAAPAINGFIAGILGVPFTPVIFNVSTDAGATWTPEDSGYDPGEFQFVNIGGWDDSTGTFLSPNIAPTDLVLVGTFTLAPSGTFAPETGTTLGGTVITLTGTGLSGVMQGDVLIDGVEALSVQAAPSGTSVTFITPAHAAGPVDIEVAGIGTFEDAYTYVGITSVIPRSGSAVGGQTVTIRGSGFNAASGVTFGGTAATDVQIISNTVIVCVTPAHVSGVVDVEVLGVDTGVGLYTYTLLTLPKLPDPPYRVAPVENEHDLIRREWLQWFLTLKQRVDTPVAVPAELITGAALTGVSDTNVTLSLTGSPSSALLQAVTITLGWTGFLGTTRGGTGVSVISEGDLLVGIAANRWGTLNIGAADTFLKSDGTDPAWVAGEALTRVNDTNVTLTLGGDAATALVNAASLTLGWTGQLSLTRGGTNASLTAVNGGIVYSTATALAISAAGTSNDVLRSGGAGAPTWSSPAALTKVDDTNVTLTLGGSPTTALLAATSLTLGWTGVLSVARGGTGTGTALTTGSIVFAGASGVLSQDNANLFWDDTNNRLGVLTNTPSRPVTFAGVVGITGRKDFILMNADADSGLRWIFRTETDAETGANAGTNLEVFARTDAGAATTPPRLKIIRATAGTVGINVTSPDAGVRLHVVADSGASQHAAGFISGNVGVGTLTPTVGRLQVQFSAGTDVTAIHIRNTNAALNDIARITFDVAGATGGGAGLGALASSVTVANRKEDLFFSTYDQAGGGVFERMRIFYSGGVSIGNTTDPGAANLSLTGKIAKYSNVNTVAWGVPAIYGSGRSTGQTAAVATVATYTVGAADGSFQILANVLVTTSTTHNFTCAVDYTDEGNTARTLTLSFTLVAGGALVTAIDNANGAVPYMGVPQRIRCKTATAITIKTVGTFTTVTYNVEGSILQLS